MLGNITDPRTGLPIQVGQFRRRILDESFTSATLPASLASTGAVTYNASGSFLQLATTAAVGNVASLSSSGTLAMSQLEAIEFEAVAVRLTESAPAATFLFDIRSSGDYGVRLTQSNTDETALIRQYNKPDLPIQLDLFSGAQAQKRRTLRWRLLPTLREAHLYEGDTEVAAVELDAGNSANVAAGLRLITNETVIHSLQVSALRLYTEFN